MTEIMLKNYLRIIGWMAIFAVLGQFILTIIQRNISMEQMAIEPALRSQTNLIYAVGFGFETPISLTLACLCLMASRVITYKQQTMKFVFE